MLGNETKRFSNKILVLPRDKKIPTTALTERNAQMDDFISFFQFSPTFQYSEKTLDAD